MGLKIVRTQVRTAATLAASANEFTAAMNVLGCQKFWFWIKATNAAQLASGTVTQSSYDKTNWNSTSTSSSTSGGLVSTTSGATSGITLALNAGGISVGPVIQNALSTPLPENFPVCQVPFARLKLTGGGSDITGLEVWAFRVYQHDGPTFMIDEPADSGPGA